MATLPAGKIIEGWKETMQNYNLSQAVKNLDKNDIKAAFEALDAAVDTNAAVINLWFPQPFRDAASPADKAFMLQLVLIKRYLEGV